jgi:hypothetical protein
MRGDFYTRMGNLYGVCVNRIKQIKKKETIMRPLIAISHAAVLTAVSVMLAGCVVEPLPPPGPEPVAYGGGCCAAYPEYPYYGGYYGPSVVVGGGHYWGGGGRFRGGWHH